MMFSGAAENNLNDSRGKKLIPVSADVVERIPSEIAARMGGNRPTLSPFSSCHVIIPIQFEYHGTLPGLTVTMVHLHVRSSDHSTKV